MTFCSFIREPEPHERYLSGWRRLDGEQASCPLRARLARLSRRMYIPYRWPPSQSPGTEGWENPNIPAGYTYFAQFVAHDTVRSSVSTSELGCPGQKNRNARLAPLELHTLYGNGFDGCLTGMTETDREQLRPSKLSLGQISIGEKIDESCPFRDIPRALPRYTTANPDGLRSVSIADDRNDNSALISQMTMLFTLFHNSVVDHMNEGNHLPESVSQAYFAHLFDRARDACVIAYRRIVRDDLMKRLLHPDAYAFYTHSRLDFLDPREGGALTFEYAQALRFGHAMVRPHYRVNDVLQRREELIDVLLTTSRGRPWRLPLDESWAVQWSKFFPIAGSQPNRSKRIGPSLSPDFLSDLVFDRIDETGIVGLAYRDLVNGAASPVWSVTPLIEEIRKRKPRLIQASRLLSDADYRQAAIGSWLAEDNAATGLTAEDIQDLSQDPPLLVFVLFEAAHEMHGERLGVLGSILVGEPIFKALQQGAVGKIADARSMTDTAVCLREADRPHVPVGYVTDEIASMSDLGEFLQERAGSVNSVIPFL